MNNIVKIINELKILIYVDKTEENTCFPLCRFLDTTFGICLLFDKAVKSGQDVNYFFRCKECLNTFIIKE